MASSQISSVFGFFFPVSLGLVVCAVYALCLSLPHRPVQLHWGVYALGRHFFLEFAARAPTCTKPGEAIHQDTTSSLEAMYYDALVCGHFISAWWFGMVL